MPMKRQFRKRPIVVEAEQAESGHWLVKDPYFGTFICDAETFDNSYEVIPNDHARPVRPSQLSDT